jgi:hypothetical protein
MVRKLIEDLSLSEGESQRINCPLCGGNNTFTATKQQGVVVYNCYKLGCGSKGAVPVGYQLRMWQHTSIARVRTLSHKKL